MTKRWQAYWVLVALTLGLYLVMVLWSLPTISIAADGLVPFDMRPGGYSIDDGLAFLNTISDQGRRFYLDTQLRLDTVYPGLLALVLGFGGLGLTRRRFIWVGRVIVLAAIIGAAADYAENNAIARMLSADVASLDTDIIAVSAMFTLTKAVSTSVAMGLILILLVMQALRRILA